MEDPRATLVSTTLFVLAALVLAIVLAGWVARLVRRAARPADSSIAGLRRREQRIAGAVALVPRASRWLMLLGGLLAVPGLVLLGWAVFFARGSKLDTLVWGFCLVGGAFAAMSLAAFAGLLRGARAAPKCERDMPSLFEAILECCSKDEWWQLVVGFAFVAAFFLTYGTYTEGWINALGIVLFTFGVSLFALVGYHLYFAVLVRRGYKNPLLIPVFLLLQIWILLVGMGCVFALLKYAGLEDVLTPHWVLAGGALAAGVIDFGVVHLVPRRFRRGGGNRRIWFPWKLAARLTYASIVLVGIPIGIWIFFEVPASTSTALKVASIPVVIVWLLAHYCGYVASRKAVSASTSTQDANLPVLYLRSFINEADNFVELPEDERADYTRLSMLRAGVTFEQYFGAAIRKRLGPLVALGNPYDYLAAEGAMREYAPDAGWQATFMDTARRAACILVQPGETRGLEWELVQLQSEGLDEKLFMLTPPPRREGVSFAVSRILRVIRHARLGDALFGRSSETRHRSAVASLPELNSVPAGAVIRRPNRNPVVLRKDARTPADYIEAIAKILPIRSLVGD